MNNKFDFDHEVITSSRDILDWKVRSHAIRLKLSKRDGDPYQYLDRIGFPVECCAFCGKRNNIFGIVTTLVDGAAIVTGIEYRYGTNVNGYARYCFTKGECSGKKLNPNSKAFISTVLGCDDNEALAIIHARNHSPFYRTSFSSDDEYRRSQSRGEEWRSTNGVSLEEQGRRVRDGHSIKAYQERYGDDWEEVKKKHNESKINNLDAFLTRHGESGKEKYQEYLEKINFSLEAHIRRKGKVDGTLAYINTYANLSKFNNPIATFDDVVLYALFLFSRTSLSTISSFPIEDELKKSKCMMAGLELFNKSVNDLVDACREKDPLFMSIDFKSFPVRSKYGYMFYTEDGVLFRSKLEFELYLELLNQGIHKDDISIDGCYPESKMRFDFFIKSTDTYIELAGLSGINEYDSRMQEKIKQFNPIVITQANYQESLNQIKSIYETRK